MDILSISRRNAYVKSKTGEGRREREDGRGKMGEEN
jgi:hypothetical protein